MEIGMFPAETFEVSEVGMFPAKFPKLRHGNRHVSDRDFGILHLWVYTFQFVVPPSGGAAPPEGGTTNFSVHLKV
ncbi:hypothetical protein QUF72_22395 [Desulfobacterales bacterium HSG2]|nr:hypothetical protein [Desulfobacterales bacterium HSG2]